MGNREARLDYWREVEKEVGEQILAYALGQLQTPLEPIPPFSYCLFYLTNTRLFIRYIPPERKILSIPLGGSSHKFQVQTLSISREGIRNIRVQCFKPRLLHWFSPPLASVRISVDYPEGGESEVWFTMEVKKNAFLRSLYAKDLP
ncbi:MAG: hypothetical protein N2442_14265 [Spirochaetes bacterium]|nr:hypothetical protein [Spirochaetota bacterium]